MIQESVRLMISPLVKNVSVGVYGVCVYVCVCLHFSDSQSGSSWSWNGKSQGGKLEMCVVERVWWDRTRCRACCLSHDLPAMWLPWEPSIQPQLISCKTKRLWWSGWLLFPFPFLWTTKEIICLFLSGSMMCDRITHGVGVFDLSLMSSPLCYCIYRFFFF